MDCRLQVFKVNKEERQSTATYRFAVVDNSGSKIYPANFVCMLPAKVDLVNGKSTNIFGVLFGDKSLDFAIKLLKKALRNEKDLEVKTEIKRRLKLIDPKQIHLIKCSQCKRTFQPRKIRKFRQTLCPECLKRRFTGK
jgi:hypothetical protein